MYMAGYININAWVHEKKKKDSYPLAEVSNGFPAIINKRHQKH